MDELTTLFSLTTFTFRVNGGTSFQIAAKDRVSAFEAANCKVREDKLVAPEDAFAWFDGITANTFCLGHDVFLD